MSKINEAVHSIHHLDVMTARDRWLNNIHPLSKLIVTLWYITWVVSFDKYNFSGLLGMSLYLIVIMMIGDLSFIQSLERLKVIMLLVCMVGIANPFFDRTIIGNIGDFKITGGMVSMLTLMLKGIFSMLASYVLVISTSIESICYALRLLRIPKIMITLIMLIYRYIIVMLKEAERISLAYSMRAPNQKGIHYKAWGTLVGQLLLRSVDRAEAVYESMTLRGFDGNFYIHSRYRFDLKSIVYLFGWIVFILLFRMIPVFEVVGSMFI